MDGDEDKMLEKAFAAVGVMDEATEVEAASLKEEETISLADYLQSITTLLKQVSKPNHMFYDIIYVEQIF